jgi:formylmethanofuran dehydrogenase subunit E
MADLKPGDIIQTQGLTIRVLGWQDIEKKFSDLKCDCCGRKLYFGEEYPVKQGKVICGRCADALFD